MAPEWLRNAVLYEIYPQSFADSDGDGIGDLRGVIDRLDHIASLGVDAIWFNPCFASPFVDAGYDVSDYLAIAPRYGTNDDLEELVRLAGERGIRVLLDLVVGHTSIEHPWFQAELHASRPSPEGDRYIWTEELPEQGWAVDLPGTPSWVPSPGPRPGWYLRNFYDEQPALSFGWLHPDPALPWMDAMDAPGPRRNVEALREILDFWLSKGVAGFRVDMAFSLVKDYEIDGGLAASTAVWRELREWLDTAHPDAVLLPEGTEPRTGERLAFDADFELVIWAAHASLFDNGGAGTLPFQGSVDPFFDAAGQGSTEVFLEAWERARQADPDRLVLLATADHDFSRLRCGSRGPEQLGAAFTFLCTFGTVPCLYYGDEIGMRYLPGTARRRGCGLQPALQPRRLPHPDAVGLLAQCRLLHRRSRRAVPSRRSCLGPADGGRPGRRTRLDADVGARAAGAAPRDAGLAGWRLDPGRRWPVSLRLAARRLAPGRGQPAA